MKTIVRIKDFEIKLGDIFEYYTAGYTYDTDGEVIDYHYYDYYKVCIILENKKMFVFDYIKQVFRWISFSEIGFFQITIIDELILSDKLKEVE